MKKRYTIKAAALLCITALCINTSCSSDETIATDGRTELRLTSGIEVDTRSYPTQSSLIADGEKVNVWVDDAGNSDALYENNELESDGKGNFSGGTKMYFPETGNNVNIYALHGNLTDATKAGGKFSVTADQSNGGTTYTTSDLLAAYAKNVARNGDPTTQALTFYHMLSKIELQIVEGDGSPELATTGAVTISDVATDGTLALNYDNGITPTITLGSTTTTMTLPQEISSDTYNEAIIVPQDMAGKVLLFKLADGGTLSYTFPNGTTFESGNKYVYKITLSLTGLKVSSSIKEWGNGGETAVKADLSEDIPVEIDLSSNNGETIAIEGDGIYRFTGTGKSKITINGSPTVILDNATFKNYSYDFDNLNLITVTGGTPTIKLVGENTVDAQYYIHQLIALKNGAGVIIDGDDSGILRANVDGVYDSSPLIGTAYDYQNKIEAGNIEIKNATLSFSVISSLYSPIIGASSTEYDSSCGNIFIENSTLYVTANGSCYSPVIGAADFYEFYAGYIGKASCKDINIISSTLEITEYSNSNGYPFIGAKNADYSTFGNINIYLKEGDTKESFLNSLTWEYDNIDNDSKIGYYENGEESESSINWYDYGKY